jgi:oligoribonuclease
MNEGRWFWVDLETGGLETHTKILEVGVVITDFDLNELHHASTLVAFDDAEKQVPQLSQWALDTHSQNGLLAELLDPTTPKIRSVELADWLLKIAREWGCAKGPDYMGSPLCGSSVHFDRRILEARALTFTREMSYRNIDVSTIHELCKAWFNTYHDESSTPAHRVIGDLKFSIDRLRWYRARGFNPHDRRPVVQGPGGAK